MKMLRIGLIAAASALALSAHAQNITTVNGKGVPKSRVDALMSQAVKQGAKPGNPEFEKQVRDEVVRREILTQEAERRGLQKSSDYTQQLEVTRQLLLIRALFSDEEKKAKPTEAAIKAAYDKQKAAAGDKEYRARHILVEKEEDAKALLAQLKGGAKFDDLAKKNSKDTGSAENGGDLDWAAAGSYVPEFSAALTKLQKGQLTDAPVKTQFGFHVIRLDDVRDAQFPALEDVKPQIEQQLVKEHMGKFIEDLRNKAKTDYKFSS